MSCSVRSRRAAIATGHLQASSNIRPSRLFTADGAIIAYRLGAIARAKLSEVTQRLVSLVSGEAPGL
jgi:mRNA interferase MazF